MQYFQTLFDTFLALFPSGLQWLVALAVLGIMVMSVVFFFKKHWVFLIIVILLLPFSVPALKEILFTILEVVKYIWGKTGL